MQSTSRSECQELFDNGWQTVNPRKYIKLNTLLCTYYNKNRFLLFISTRKLIGNYIIKECLTKKVEMRRSLHLDIQMIDYMYQYDLKGCFTYVCLFSNKGNTDEDLAIPTGHHAATMQHNGVYRATTYVQAYF